MILRYCAEFQSTLPEECGAVGVDGFEKYAGPVANAISEMLRRLGYDADPPTDAGDHGWEFEVRVKGYPSGARLVCTITLIHDYFLILDNTSSWDKFRKRYPAPYIEALNALSREMTADPRFSEIRWNLPQDACMDRPGAPHPVDDG
jgi:hypothetical protein